MMRKGVLQRCSSCFVVECSSRFYGEVTAVHITPLTPNNIKIGLSNEMDDV
jgi:hypothetical protein